MTRIRKIALTVLMMLCVVALINLSRTSRQQAQIQSQENIKERKTKEPLVADVFDIAPEPSDGEDRAKRKAKNKRYEKGAPDAKRLVELPPNTGAGRVEHTSDIPPLPVALSDSIVLGTVTNIQPYLTEAETSIYSEFTITIEEVFKNDENGSLLTGKTIVVDREGGALRLSNGRVLRYEVSGVGKLPRLDKKYVFFLKRINQGQDISILSGYELRGGSVFSLNGYSPFEGTDVTVFLDEVRRVVSTQQLSSERGVSQ
jgi:hypothetical protein